MIEHYLGYLIVFADGSLKITAEPIYTLQGRDSSEYSLYKIGPEVNIVTQVQEVKAAYRSINIVQKE